MTDLDAETLAAAMSESDLSPQPASAYLDWATRILDAMDGKAMAKPPRRRTGHVLVSLPQPVMHGLIRLAIREDRDVEGQARRIITEAVRAVEGEPTD